MSLINSNPAALALPSVLADFEQSANGGSSVPAPAFRQPSDAILPRPWSPLPSFGSGFGDSNAAGGNGGFGALVNNLMSALSNLFSQLGAMANFGQASGRPSGQPAEALPGQPAQTYYTDAHAGSVGDPHESFSGTTPGGANSATKWDDMHSHDDLLGSTSFEGGYQISTTATSPRPSGVTLNDDARVTTDGGQTTVQMNKDGSYEVSSFGRDVALETGQAVRLSGAETVTLNADRSLTIDEHNGRDGSISTTLRSNADGGVDVSANAHDVALGGYLVNRTDRDHDGDWRAGMPGARESLGAT